MPGVSDVENCIVVQRGLQLIICTDRIVRIVVSFAFASQVRARLVLALQHSQPPPLHARIVNRGIRAASEQRWRVWGGAKWCG